ncbi:MAG TPA: NAD-dependent epimerase/dehydratase family protein, partial [Myxococcota bacterium]|nr:NAD-dependent epimerase/dehydratase family protein [Myxococcota bacterium]
MNIRGLGYGALRAIVTGGAGFVGSHVAEALVARGDEVHVLDSLVTGSREKVPAGAELHVGDIRSDAPALFDAVRPGLVCHLAAQADVNTSVERPEYDAEVNVWGTLQILQAARACGAHVVFSSTGGAIYGECDGPAA